MKFESLEARVRYLEEQCSRAARLRRRVVSAGVVSLGVTLPVVALSHSTEAALDARIDILELQRIPVTIVTSPASVVGKNSSKVFSATCPNGTRPISGLELAIWCDLGVAARDAVFGVYCRRWGVPLIDGGTVGCRACSVTVMHWTSSPPGAACRALRQETRRGLEVIASGETLEGAERFAKGVGRHGEIE